MTLLQLRNACEDLMRECPETQDQEVFYKDEYHEQDMFISKLRKSETFPNLDSEEGIPAILLDY